MSELSVWEAPRKRRRFTAEFKARIVEACQQPGASVAGIALEHALNANLVHKWIREARQSAPVSDTPAFVQAPQRRRRPSIGKPSVFAFHCRAPKAR